MVTKKYITRSKTKSGTNCRINWKPYLYLLTFINLLVIWRFAVTGFKHLMVHQKQREICFTHQWIVRQQSELWFMHTLVVHLTST